ncbi:hypothetical protein [Adhaeribacter rhizoryzae]|uniref:Uncharacterized protein n=1 Tax=Adhaeribacter rhizoryzae TaxID=2607907 RepID=A0A5M6DK93_9BACT|nr:hypothetical protein [Adhaeribacter rhizoryzae]KAA5545735.1 hypothetical protein F0145_12445 [Adhaeribacter rhizoryzae]
MLAQEEFKVLTTTEQVAILRNHGNYIHYRVKGWCKIELYWFHKFYVEIWYLHNDQTVGLIRVLTGKPSLEPYLDTIQLKVV